MTFRLLILLIFGVCVVLSSDAQQASPLPEIDSKAGEWLKFPEDGSAWKHPDTDLRFPMELAGFVLKKGFRDQRAEAGTALTYAHKSLDVKADILLTPCPKKIATMVDVMPAVKGSLEQTAKDLAKAAAAKGYQEDAAKRGKLELGKMTLWEAGEIPAAQMKVELIPAPPATAETLPSINEWLNLTLYQDSWIMTSVVMQSKLGAEGEKARVAFVQGLMQTIRDPSLLAQMIRVCDDYIRDPLSDTGRENADHLLAFSRESPIVRITLPGEALTSALNEIAVAAPGNEKDVLRAFLVGSGAKSLLEESIDSRLEEGARVMSHVYLMLQKKDPKVQSATMNQIVGASAQQQAADWLRKRMNAPRAE